MAYWRWGDALAPHVVVCAHGLTRQGRDFDRLAQALIESGKNPATAMWAYCQDIDRAGALMCFIQLSLWNIPAAVIVDYLARGLARESVRRFLNAPSTEQIIFTRNATEASTDRHALLDAGYSPKRKRNAASDITSNSSKATGN